ncbi:hypothetical protein EDD21DRAFT_408094 [Dissophora ornata]|nr:hypothetical protein EDD21DRAFT_408094 [Dissophora ornata]
MFCGPFPPWRSVLSPRVALGSAKSNLENARQADQEGSPELALTFCNESRTALDRIRNSVRKHLVSSESAEDRAMRNGIASTYFGLGELLNKLDSRKKAQACYKRSEKWRGREIPSRDIAIIPAHIFAQDMHQPPDINKLPEADERLKNTSHLVYCLGLLQSSQSTDDALDPTEQTWLNITTQNADERERLETVPLKLLKEFAREELSDANTVTEIVRLVPVFNKDQLYQLLQRLFYGIEKSQLLDLNLLEGLAQLTQHARPGHLKADDLVKILDLISKRLISTHEQSPDYIYRLALTVSRVLDVMADSEVKDLDRENLHAPLAVYLQGLGSNTDPYLVYQAAYAAQALLKGC